MAAGRPRVKEVVAIIEEIAPPRWAEEWDNVGLLTGSPQQEVEKILLVLDVDGEVIELAKEKRVQLIVSHHPLIFKPLRSLGGDRPPALWLRQLIKHDIALYAAHTSFDNSRPGVSDALANLLNLTGVQPLRPLRPEPYYKLVVYVPPEHAAALRLALGDAGAGWIGNYSHCTFAAPGTGTFLPREGTNPYLGRPGELAEVEEVRLETLVPAWLLDKVLAAMRRVHPYEEIAYDLFRLENRPPGAGLGRVGELPQPCPLSELVATVKEKLKLTAVRWGGAGDRMVRRVAVCGGSGADLWPAACQQGADVLITGDVGYHAARDMLAAGLAFIDAGHYGSEKPALELLAGEIKQRLQRRGLTAEVETFAGREPFNYTVSP